MYETGGLPAYANYQAADNWQSLDLLAPASSGLAWMIRRYLLQKAISVFEWTMPKAWAKNYVLYCLYCFGRVAVVNTDRFGVIAQACGLMGYNVYYQPTNAIITNALLSGNLEPRIGTECTVLRLQPDYGGIMDLVTMYSNLMGQAIEAAGVSLNNSKVARIFFSTDKAAADKWKKVVDQINNGQPAVFVDKKLRDADGTPSWDMETIDVRSQYILTDLLADLRKIESMFDTEIGIPNANTDKRERLITSEVEANTVETYSKCSLWLEELQASCRETRDMFGIDINVDWRKNPAPVDKPVESVENDEI